MKGTYRKPSVCIADVHSLIAIITILLRLNSMDLVMLEHQMMTRNLLAKNGKWNDNSLKSTSNSCKCNQTRHVHVVNRHARSKRRIPLDVLYWACNYFVIHIRIIRRKQFYKVHNTKKQTLEPLGFISTQRCFGQDDHMHCTIAPS